jgi:hypothetical protein
MKSKKAKSPAPEQYPFKLKEETRSYQQGFDNGKLHARILERPSARPRPETTFAELKQAVNLLGQPLTIYPDSWYGRVLPSGLTLFSTEQVLSLLPQPTTWERVQDEQK